MKDILFIGKKLVSKAIYPVGAVLVLWISGLIVRRYRPNSSAGTVLILLGGVLLAVMASPITSYILLQPLESWAGPYADPEELMRKNVRYVVVLGGITAGQDLSPADGWGNAIFRVMEGARLCRRMPGSRLVLLQPGFYPIPRYKEKMAALPNELGIPERDLILERGALDTGDEAVLVRGVVGEEPFALVTSAYHMPRALKIFRKAGLNPIPAPCEYITAKFPHYIDWFGIDAMSILRSQLAIHEYVGIVWLMITNELLPARLRPLNEG
ncbi:MAG: YdcF family protein [Desulfomonile tiedjei]|uniref:YdcF family protein n=1 Tax=Desulfomonile tiedjei TaxID=2358 RepID=A0A9D6V2D9_9BACT|nr:YdcF family protein [Desulfomonile tiedjei]